VTTVAARRERRMWLGVGLRTSSVSLGEEQDAQGLGLIGRLRFRSIELELDIGKVAFEDSPREDSRIGGALIVPLTRGRWQPYLLVGAGVNVIHMDDVEIDRQGYLEGGGGLSLRLGRGFSISGDVRWSSRKSIEEGGDYHIQTVDGAPEERGVEGRISGILYF
jgi:hypothetical protein